MKVCLFSTPGQNRRKGSNQLAGTQSCSIRIVRVGKSQRRGSTSSGQHDGHCLHKEDGGTHSLSLCQESHQLWREAIRRNITILPPQWLSTTENTEADILSRHRLQKWDFKLISAEFWRIRHLFQIWPTWDAFTSEGSHQVLRYMTLGRRPQGSCNQHPRLQLGSDNLVVSPGPPHSSSTGGGSRAAGHGNFDLSGVDRSSMVASAGQTEDRNGSNPSASCSGLPQVSQGEQGGAPKLGSTLRFSVEKISRIWWCQS